MARRPKSGVPSCPDSAILSVADHLDPRKSRSSLPASINRTIVNDQDLCRTDRLSEYSFKDLS
jgi:hypothetical protein